MSKRPEALLYADLLDAGFDPNAKAIAAFLRTQHALNAELVDALRIARDFMSIASDWNVDEAEINGEMRSTYDWLEVLDAALSKAEVQQ